MDYRQPGVWDGLADALETSFSPEPRPVFGHVTCEPGWSWRFSMRDYDLWLVSGGRGTVFVGDQRIAVSAGSLLVLRPGDTGWGVQDPNNRLTVTYLHFDMVRPGSRSETVRVPGPRLPSRYLRMRDAHAIHEPLLSVVRFAEQGDRLSSLQARLMLTRVLVEIYRQDAETAGHGPRHRDPRVQEVMRYVRSRPAERPSLEEVATLAQVSPSHLRRLFARELGTSYRSFVVQSRMERARFLLQESLMSVGEVARALGYSDAVLFSHQFRRRYGFPPSRVRRPA